MKLFALVLFCVTYILLIAMPKQRPWIALGSAALADDVTWADYQAYLIEAAGGNAPNLDEFKGQVYAIGSWDEMPLDQSPWDMLFTMVGVSTWDEFQAGQLKSSQVAGAMA